MEHFYQKIGEDWFTFHNLYREMVEKSKDGSHFVEVGVWRGRSASYMGVEIHNSGKNIKFDCVDTWEGSSEHCEYQILKTKDGLYNEYLNNIKPLSHIINSIRMTSIEASKMYKDESLDFVFIDAAHDEQSVKDDIIHWLPKVKKNGILAGHDYDWSGVKSAVHYFFNKSEIIDSEGCWIYKKIKNDMKYYNDLTPDSQWGIVDTNQFKVNDDFSKRFFVVENFYQDPHGVRELALGATYFEGEGAVGSRTRKQFLFEGVKEKFEEIMGKKILDHTDNNQGWRDGGINGRFQTCNAGTPLVYHCDSQKWAGMVYLTPDAPPQCGTTFFKHRKTGIRHNNQIDWSSGQGLEVFNQKTFLDSTPYEMVDKIGNVFNRLVIFDGGLIHSASEYFGWDLESSRLFHMFFFDTEN